MGTFSSSQNYENLRDPLYTIHEANVSEYTLQYDWRGMNRNGTYIILYDILTSYTELGLIDRLVYSAIRTYSNMNIYGVGTTNVSNETIALRLDIGSSTVSKSVKKLQSLGIIMLKKHPSKHERIIYLVRDFKDPQPEQIEGDEQYHDLTPKGLDELSLKWFIEKREPKKVNEDDDIDF